MRKDLLQTVTVLAGLVLMFTLPSCGKDDNMGGLSGIQKGDTTVSIYAGVYKFDLNYNLFELRIKYNHVISTEITAVVRFYIHAKGQKDLTFTIPAGNQNPKAEINGQYLNNWIYSSTEPDTWAETNGASLIDASWEVDSVKLIGVHTADKHYGFKVLGKDDTWPAYFDVKNPKTTLQFAYNNKQLRFESYDFEAGWASYSTQQQNYILHYFDNQIQIITSGTSYPLEAGMVIKIPFMLFFDQKTYGGSTDKPDGSNDTYSTLKLTITKVQNNHYDGQFEGKLFSSRQTDTLFITDGIIKNALMPEKE